MKTYIPVLLSAGVLAACFQSTPKELDQTAEAPPVTSDTCTYNGIEAYCGQLAIRVSGSSDAFDKTLQQLTQALANTGGVIIDQIPDFRHVVLQYPDSVDLLAERDRLVGLAFVEFAGLNQPSDPSSSLDG